MLKETMTYTDYNEVERTEDFYFHLSKAEIMEMELSIAGGFTALAAKIAATQDTPMLVKIFKELILKTYGEKSPDGKQFLKVDDNGRPLSVGFSQTEAYSILFMKLATDADAATKFINGIVPSDVSKELAKKQAKTKIENNN